ncbi:MAG TPA: AMP-binding protein, partial [Mycobacterium sp.]|nr:AMP-binding protein [Mycobacterium sp.]
MTSDPRTVPAVLDRIARQLPNHDALIDGDQRFTYAQLRTAVHRAAAAMLAVGVAPEDRVAIWSPNTWHWVVACLAVSHTGAVVVPLNTRYTPDEATDILARTGAPLLIAMGTFLGNDRVGKLPTEALPRLRQIVRVPVDDPDEPAANVGHVPTLSWPDFLALGAATDRDLVATTAARVSGDDVNDILFTSGTTGRSKGVMCAHRQSLGGSAAWAACGKVTSDDRYLCINPFFHNFGYKAGILACLQTGATLIPHLTFDPERALNAVQSHRITV